MDLTWLTRIGGALALVGLAAGISFWQRLNLEKDIAVAVIRAFIQLIAIGYALNLIFMADTSWWILLVVAVMIGVAGITAGNRGAGVPRSHLIATVSIISGALITLGLLLVLNVFELKPRYIIPIAGMLVGNSMIVTGLVMKQMYSELKQSQALIETALSLGATARQAAGGRLKEALATGMSPIVDRTKTVGLISLPGAMTGMLIAGATPLEAVRLQIIVMYMLIGASAFSGLTAALLSYRQFFSKAHQLLPFET